VSLRADVADFSCLEYLTDWQCMRTEIEENMIEYIPMC